MEVLTQLLSQIWAIIIVGSHTYDAVYIDNFLKGSIIQPRTNVENIDVVYKFTNNEFYLKQYSCT